MNEKEKHGVMIGGTGGQGVITIGYILADAASHLYKNVTRFPIYLAAQRGGAAYCTVVFSDDEIAAPILSKYNTAIAMDAGSYARFTEGVKEGGKLFVNSSLVQKIDDKPNIVQYTIPVIDLAREMGAPFLANMIMLGAYIQGTNVLNSKFVQDAIKGILADEGKENRLALNLKAYEKGVEYAKQYNW